MPASWNGNRAVFHSRRMPLGVFCSHPSHADQFESLTDKRRSLARDAVSFRTWLIKAGRARYSAEFRMLAACVWGGEFFSELKKATSVSYQAPCANVRAVSSPAIINARADFSRKCNQFILATYECDVGLRTRARCYRLAPRHTKKRSFSIITSFRARIIREGVMRHQLFPRAVTNARRAHYINYFFSLR